MKRIDSLRSTTFPFSSTVPFGSPASGRSASGTNALPQLPPSQDLANEPIYSDLLDQLEEGGVTDSDDTGKPSSIIIHPYPQYPKQISVLLTKVINYSKLPSGVESWFLYLWTSLVICKQALNSILQTMTWTCIGHPASWHQCCHSPWQWLDHNDFQWCWKYLQSRGSWLWTPHNSCPGEMPVTSYPRQVGFNFCTI